MARTLTLPTPDDFHLHLRDGAMLEAVLPATARVFARAIVMPNLVPPVVTTADAVAYRQRIMAALPEGMAFTPLMTAYLTEATDPDDLERGFGEGVFTAVKLYPAHATTNSAHGVGDLRTVYPVFERLERIDGILCIHGEVTDPEVDVFDREAVFIERTLAPLRRDFPNLRIVLEHVTSKAGADFVEAADDRLGATVTPQHLMVDRNAMLVGGIRPHLYCLPILKRRRDRDALRRLVEIGFPRLFLGTDSAPHAQHLKENACGCAGCYSAPVALEAYAQVFDEIGCLQRLPDFASRFGARFYGLAANAGTVTLVEEAWTPPEQIVVGGDVGTVRPLLAGEVVRWRVADRP
ncbi:MAG: dihydroorotase [Geminicoccaceae bacterium]|nr:MAG: dihydroorotase [Geminicoccaceae bacterium]